MPVETKFSGRIIDRNEALPLLFQCQLWLLVQCTAKYLPEQQGAVPPVCLTVHLRIVRRTHPSLCGRLLEADMWSRRGQVGRDACR